MSVTDSQQATQTNGLKIRVEIIKFHSGLNSINILLKMIAREELIFIMLELNYQISYNEVVITRLRITSLNSNFAVLKK